MFLITTLKTTKYTLKNEKRNKVYFYLKVVYKFPRRFLETNKIASSDFKEQIYFD